MTQLWWKYTIPDGTLQLWKNELQGCDFHIAERALHALADETNEWPSFAQYRRLYRAKTPLPENLNRLPAPKASRKQLCNTSQKCVLIFVTRRQADSCCLFIHNPHSPSQVPLLGGSYLRPQVQSLKSPLCSQMW